MIFGVFISRLEQLLSKLIDTFLLEPARITSNDRSVLEEVILPYFAKAMSCQKILFVGCAAYTQWYEELFQQKEYWTIDPKKAKRQYGSARHIIDSIAHIQRYVTKDYFDVIVINGVIGYGLNRIGEIEQAIDACYEVLAPQGVLLVGWNDTAQRTPIDIRATRAVSKFREYAFEPLHSCHYRTEGAHRHTFSFYRKES
jgi:Nodulation protein S (NodS)